MGFPENLNTPWRSPYRARGTPPRWISPCIRVHDEVATGVLLGTKHRVDHGAGGAVHGQQQGELRALLIQPPVVAAVNLHQHPQQVHVFVHTRGRSFDVPWLGWTSDQASFGLPGTLLRQASGQGNLPLRISSGATPAYFDAVVPMPRNMLDIDQPRKYRADTAKITPPDCCPHRGHRSAGGDHAY